MNHKRIPYETILAAKEGDPEAMNFILRYFDRYIDANAYHPRIRGFPDSGGGLNVEIKARIQEKLMQKIIYDYDPMRLPEGEILEV